MKTVSVLSKPYEIISASNIQVADSMYGSCDRKFQKIVIVDGIAEDQKQDTLIHEVLHIISDELGLGLDEATIQRLGVGLYSTGVRIPIHVSEENGPC